MVEYYEFGEDKTLLMRVIKNIPYAYRDFGWKRDYYLNDETGGSLVKHLRENCRHLTKFEIEYYGLE